MKRTSREDARSRGHDVKIYPTEPLSEGRAFIEYVVRKSALGDFEMEKWRPRGTAKSRRALEERVKLEYRLSSFHPVAL